MAADLEADRPLHGVRVVDFTIVMSGPLCTRMLADAGADVVKVEPPDADAVRERPPMRSGISTYYASLNCGKRSIVLDLKDREDLQIARGLIREADIVVENFRPGVMKKLGLDHGSVAADNPRLIYCSVSGFGQTGPMAHAPAYAPVIHAASGYELAHMAYQPSSSRPANNGIFIADVMGAVQAFGAINLALFDRERTGLGQSIDVSLMDSVLGMLVYEIQAAQFPPDKRRQVYEPVRAQDGFVMVAAVTPKNLDALFSVIGFPEGTHDPRFATFQSKEENWSALLEIVESWTIRRSALECEQQLMRAGVPCSRYRSVADVLADPATQARGFMSTLGSEAEPFMVPNVPFRFSRSHVRARPILAQLGEHTQEVLEEFAAREKTGALA